MADSTKPKGYSVIEVGQDDDDDYVRRLAASIERESIPRMIKLGLVDPNSSVVRRYTTTNTTQLKANCARQHEEAYNAYMQHQPKCSVCNNPIPYERRRLQTCSTECAHKTMTDAERKEKAKQKYIEYVNRPGVKERIAKRMHEFRATEEFKAKRREHDRNRYHNDPEYRRHKLDKNAEWNKAHPESVISYQIYYHDMHKDDLAAKNAARYAENKLGKAICTSCHQEYLVTDKTTTICNNCKQKALAHTKNNTWYVGPYHRQILRMAGRLTPELDNKDFIVHHIDGIKDHNSLDNLMILSRADHTFLHNQIKHMAYEAQQNGETPLTMADATKRIVHDYNISTY